MLIYHASDTIVNTPDTMHSRTNLDFGKGFYATVIREQAERYAQRFILRNRKGILNQIEQTIKKNFYKDADDAAEYYFDRVKRKKEHGAKYDDNILQETEDEFEGDEA